MALSAELRAALACVTTATITTVLLGHGVRNSFIRGAAPLAPGDVRRAVGEAFTLRFVPMREDLATPASWASPTSTRAAIEQMPEGAICVADAMGVRDAGIFGDILCARMAVRGVAGLVTDGVLRDGAGVAQSGLSVWCGGLAAPASVAALTFVGWQQPIGCGGVAVLPGDVIVADGDGAVVVPRALVEGVAEAAVVREREEAWVMGEVQRGVALPGLYPMSDETRARYEGER